MQYGAECGCSFSFRNWQVVPAVANAEASLFQQVLEVGCWPVYQVIMDHPLRANKMQVTNASAHMHCTCAQSLRAAGTAWTTCSLWTTTAAATLT
jgi:hypothetical protein